MSPLAVTEYTKKHGTTFLLVCAIFWLNNRLSNVEEKLYDCLEDKQELRNKNANNQFNKHLPIFAVLPKNETYERTKRKSASKNA
jgi:hypothetical protein